MYLSASVGDKSWKISFSNSVLWASGVPPFCKPFADSAATDGRAVANSPHRSGLCRPRAVGCSHNITVTGFVRCTRIQPVGKGAGLLERLTDCPENLRADRLLLFAQMVAEQLVAGDVVRQIRVRVRNVRSIHITERAAGRPEDRRVARGRTKPSWVADSICAVLCPRRKQWLQNHSARWLSSGRRSVRRSRTMACIQVGMTGRPARRSAAISEPRSPSASRLRRRLTIAG